MRSDTSLLGKAKELEIASLLIEHGLYVFLPLVDKGFDLIVGNKNCSKLLPVQVKFRQSGPALNLQQRDIDLFRGTDVLLAYVVGVGESKRVWLIPFVDWDELKVGGHRRDEMYYVTISKNETRLRRFEGENGVENLKRLLDAMEAV